MPRERTFVFAIGDDRVTFKTRLMKWILERLKATKAAIEERDRADPPGPVIELGMVELDTLIVLIEEELQNRNPRPITLDGGEVDMLYPLAKTYAEGFPGWADMIALRDALAEDRHRRRLPD